MREKIKKIDRKLSFLQTSNLKPQRGYSITEVLVSVLIFSIIVGAGTGVFVSAIKLQRYNLTHQRLIGQVNYAIEYMTRAIRMARKDDGTCGFNEENYNYADPPNNNWIEFQTYNGECWKFFLEDGQLKIDKHIDKHREIYELTSSDFQVTDFRINVSGDESEKQPKATIYMEIKGGGSDPQPKLKIQTTVSQRNLNF